MQSLRCMTDFFIRALISDRAHHVTDIVICNDFACLRLLCKPTPVALFTCVQHGETEANVLGRLGGDSPLTDNGLRFARELARFVEAEGIERPRVWTSHYERTITTARFVRNAVRESWRALNELDGGICDGMTYEQIKDVYPEEYAKREADKFRYRYPMGEVSASLSSNTSFF